MTLEHISSIVKQLGLDLEKEYLEQDIDLEDTMSTLKVLNHLKKDFPSIEHLITIIENLIRDNYHNKLYKEGLERACNNKVISESIKKISEE